MQGGNQEPVPTSFPFIKELSLCVSQLDLQVAHCGRMHRIAIPCCFPIKPILLKKYLADCLQSEPQGILRLIAVIIGVVKTKGTAQSELALYQRARI